MRPLTPPATVAALVLLAAVLHAGWNALIKGSRDPVAGQAVIVLVGTVLAACAVPWLPVPARAAWPLLAGSIVAHTAYYTLLVAAYREGDLSKVYPLARGLAPLLVALAASRLAGETLLAWEWVGALCVSAGIGSLAFEKRNALRPGGHSVALALSTGLCVSCYSLIDGLGARRAGSALGYAAWLFLFEGLPFIGAVVYLRRRSLGPAWRGSWKPGLVGGVIATAAYTIVIWAMSVGGMAQAIALRETSVIVAALIGVFLFKDAGGVRRIAAAAVVVCGNLLLQLA